MMRHQEPPTAPRGYCMKRHAAGGLHHQQEQPLGIALNALEESAAPNTFLVETSMDMASASLSGTCIIVSKAAMPPPKSALAPTKPSSPIVAISTMAPF